VEPGHVLRDRYRLDEHIAVGGMGEVWQGTDLVLDRKVAVKLLRPEHAEDSGLHARFRAEARLAGLLSHPNIAQVYDFREAAAPEPAYLVMEFVEGRSLARLLDDGPLEPARAMDIIAQAARGLAAAHRAGLVHRDIKPGNLLVRDDGLIKVTDFGIARAESATPLTQTGQLPGTPGYMAPERAAGAVATAATDLYSLGVVAHQCLTGRPPFAGDALAVVLAHMEREMPPLPASVPVGVAALISDLTRKDPRERPLSAENVAAEAERLRVQSEGARSERARSEETQSEGEQSAAPLPAAGPEQSATAPTLPATAAALSAAVLALSAPARPDAEPTRTDLPPVADRGAERFSLLQPGTWDVLRRVRSIGRLAERLPGVGRVSWPPARVGLAAVAVVAIGTAGLVGWMLGAARPATTGRPTPPAARSGHHVGSAAPTPPFSTTPADQPSTQPSATPTASPTPTPSVTPTPTPTPTVSPSSSASPNPSASATPTPNDG
jgi:eukaryotic-like serine/threonine-protein kinase